MSRIYFFDELAEDIRHEQLQEYEAHIQKILRDYKKLQKQHSDENEKNGRYYEWATLYYGLQSIQGMIRWLKYVKEQKPLSGFMREDE